MKLFENPKALMEFLAKNEVSCMKDLMKVIKEQILAPAANELLKDELTEHLSYEKYETGKKSGSNSRNGARGKTVNSNFGELEIQVPRDCGNEYEPQLIKNHQSDPGSMKRSSRCMQKA